MIPHMHMAVTMLAIWAIVWISVYILSECVAIKVRKLINYYFNKKENFHDSIAKRLP